MKEFEAHVDQFSKEWTLFLDRDGVINKRLLDDYIKTIEEFEFLPGVIDAIRLLSGIFGRIIIVSNQQGIGKGLMTVHDLQNIHEAMIKEINKGGGSVAAIFYCPDLKSKPDNCRKPGNKMALQAKENFPDIDFTKSVMAGDTSTDIEFGKNMNMITIAIGIDTNTLTAHFQFTSLKAFAEAVQHNALIP